MSVAPEIAAGMTDEQIGLLSLMAWPTDVVPRKAIPHFDLEGCVRLGLIAKTSSFSMDLTDLGREVAAYLSRKTGDDA
jgi:hypothetical protein